MKASDLFVKCLEEEGIDICFSAATAVAGHFASPGDLK